MYKKDFDQINKTFLMYICFWCYTEIMNAFYLSDEKCDEKIQLFYCTRVYNFWRNKIAFQ